MARKKLTKSPELKKEKKLAKSKKVKKAKVVHIHGGSDEKGNLLAYCGAVIKNKKDRAFKINSMTPYMRENYDPEWRDKYYMYDEGVNRIVAVDSKMICKKSLKIKEN